MTTKILHLIILFNNQQTKFAYHYATNDPDEFYQEKLKNWGFAYKGLFKNLDLCFKFSISRYQSCRNSKDGSLFCKYSRN